MAPQYVAPLELPPTELAGVGGGDATLVPLVPGHGGLVLIGPATLITTILQALTVLASPGFLSQIPVGLHHVHQRGN